MARTCSDEEQEFCGGCGDCDDGLCMFCGSEDCDGSGYNCPDGHYQEYNLRGWPEDPDDEPAPDPRPTPWDEAEATDPESGE